MQQDNHITNNEIIVVLNNLLKEARQNSFNTNHSLFDTKAEREAQILINKLKQNANQ